MNAEAFQISALDIVIFVAFVMLVVSVGLLYGAITHWLGIHAVLGFFLAGTMAGTAARISDELRRSLSDTVHAIFVPLFFATLGIKLDFIAGLDKQVVHDLLQGVELGVYM